MPHMTEGTFQAEVARAYPSFSQTGTECILVKFKILEGPNKDEEIEWKGWLSDAALKYTFKALRTCGWKGNDIANLTMLPGTKVSLVLADETYNESTHTKVQWINPLVQEMPPEQVKDLSERMAKEVMRLGMSDEPATPPKSKADDKIPF